MAPLYVIRNTTKDCEHNRHNLFVLEQTVKKYVIEHCEVIIVDSDDQSINTFHSIINLDPFSRQSSHYSLDICRKFENNSQENPIGFTSRTNVSIEEQIAKIPHNLSYVIVDDDIASGATKKFVESITQHLQIIEYVSLLRLWLNNNNYLDRKIYDCIDTHDFWGNKDSSGLLVNGKRQYYWSDAVNIQTRANLKIQSQQYLRKNIIL